MLSWGSQTSGYIYETLLHLRIREHYGGADRKKSQEIRDFAVRLCLLLTTEALPVMSHQHDQPNMNWITLTSIIIPPSSSIFLELLVSDGSGDRAGLHNCILVGCDFLQFSPYVAKESLCMIISLPFLFLTKKISQVFNHIQRTLGNWLKLGVGEVPLSEEEHANRFSSTKWSVLETYIQVTSH